MEIAVVKDTSLAQTNCRLKALNFFKRIPMIYFYFRIAYGQLNVQAVSGTVCISTCEKVL